MKSFIRESKLQLLLLIALTILILCPLLMIFTKAVFVNGRFDFTYAFEIIFKNENIQTCLQLTFTGFLGCHCFIFDFPAAGFFTF